MSHAVVLVAIDGDVPREQLEAAVSAQMEPFDEGNRWFKDGSRWDWWVIGGRWPDWFGSSGSIVRKCEFDTNAYRKYREAEVRGWWAEALASEDRNPAILKMFYGVKPEDTVDTYVTRLSQDFPTAHSFLRERHWNEGARMGWFGANTATECELSGQKPKRCLTKGKRGAQVVTWNEDRETWNAEFVRRFITPLEPDTWLVAVDYHV